MAINKATDTEGLHAVLFATLAVVMSRPDKCLSPAFDSVETAYPFGSNRENTRSEPSRHSFDVTCGFFVQIRRIFIYIYV